MSDQEFDCPLCNGDFRDEGFFAHTPIMKPTGFTHLEDSTPDEGLPVRILEAYLVQNCNAYLPSPGPHLDDMYKDICEHNLNRKKSGEIIRAAIAKLRGVDN